MAEPSRAQTIAKAFHESYERQAPLFGYQTRQASAVDWADVPADNKRLMMAVVNDLLDRGIIYANLDSPVTPLTPRTMCY
jgi:hypothetical protein